MHCSARNISLKVRFGFNRLKFFETKIIYITDQNHQFMHWISLFYFQWEKNSLRYKNLELFYWELRKNWEKKFFWSWEKIFWNWEKCFLKLRNIFFFEIVKYFFFEFVDYYYYYYFFEIKKFKFSISFYIAKIFLLSFEFSFFLPEKWVKGLQWNSLKETMATLCYFLNWKCSYNNYNIKSMAPSLCVYQLRNVYWSWWDKIKRIYLMKYFFEWDKYFHI